jgi:hypothetical protein
MGGATIMCLVSRLAQWMTIRRTAHFSAPANRKPVLDELHLPLDACLRLLGVAIDHFVQQGMSEAQWEVPDEVLALFPDDVQAYFRPRQATGASAEASRAERSPAAKS